jgi:hypothetical protein
MGILEIPGLKSIVFLFAGGRAYVALCWWRYKYLVMQRHPAVGMWICEVQVPKSVPGTAEVGMYRVYFEGVDVVLKKQIVTRGNMAYTFYSRQLFLFPGHPVTRRLSER